MADYGSNYPYGASIYKDDGEGGLPPRHELAMRKLSPLDRLKDDPIFIENFEVQGRHLDLCEDSGTTLLNELFADTTEVLLSYFETTYALVVGPSDSVILRRNRIIAAMRARGGLPKQYFEDLGNKLGGSVYTVSITEGTGAIGFLVHTYSKYTSPLGPGTIIPGVIETPASVS